METLSGFVAGALFWLPRIAVISLVLTAVIWVGAKGANWFAPQRGDPAPEFQVVGGSAQSRMNFWHGCFRPNSCRSRRIWRQVRQR